MGTHVSLTSYLGSNMAGPRSISTGLPPFIQAGTTKGTQPGDPAQPGQWLPSPLEKAVVGWEDAVLCLGDASLDIIEPSCEMLR